MEGLLFSLSPYVLPVSIKDQYDRRLYSVLAVLIRLGSIGGVRVVVSCKTKPLMFILG